MARLMDGVRDAPSIAVTVQGSPGQSPQDQQRMGESIDHSRRFLESLKRSFDKQLARAGIRLP
jgi:hypothetical protein